MISEKDLQNADIVRQTAEALNVDSVTRQAAVLSAALGNYDSAVKILTIGTNAMETDKAEADNPKPAGFPKGYTAIDKAIHSMLHESTGTNMLDSGGAYGRNWQRNRQITDFRKRDELKVEVWKDGDLGFTIDIFHYLTSFLKVTPESKKLQKMFDAFEKTTADKDSWYSIIEDFAQKLVDSGKYELGGSFNSYNGESMLSQVIQGTYLTHPGEEYPDFIILQIHQGCDVRGGYTAPKIFAITEFDYMCMADRDLWAFCHCEVGDGKLLPLDKNQKQLDGEEPESRDRLSLSSDDCGYHWYVDGSTGGLSQEFKDKLPPFWKPVPISAESKNWEYKLMCERCNTEPSFHASLEY